jgi:DNA-binding winged helix-turn-helix (wHTH) protein
LLSGVSKDVFEFGGFRLDAAERRLTRGGEPVELNARYFDALRLLVASAGELVTKDRFMDEVWRNIPVTDEALTQCIRTLRKALGDEAGRPRFIETVPRHGYRFVAEVSRGELAMEVRAADPGRILPPGRRWLLLTGAGLAGGAAAGLAGGLGYGLLAATAPPPATGAISILLVMTCLCLLVGLLGGLGVGAGVGAASLLPGRRLLPLMLGGAAGGLVVGALGRLVGLDAFALVVGSRPVAITGGGEGLLIGAVAGAAAWLALGPRPLDLRRVALGGAALGAAAGLLVVLGGGQMMAGSLAVLASAHPDAPLVTLVGELGVGRGARLLTGAVEGATFVCALALSFFLVSRSR